MYVSCIWFVYVCGFISRNPYSLSSHEARPLARLNKWVFSRLLNCLSVSVESRSGSGRLFQSLGALEAKLRGPKVTVLVATLLLVVSLLMNLLHVQTLAAQLWREKVYFPHNNTTIYVNDHSYNVSGGLLVGHDFTAMLATHKASDQLVLLLDTVREDVMIWQ